MIFLYIFLGLAGLFILGHLIYFIIFKFYYKPVLMYHRITDAVKDDAIRYIHHKGQTLDLDSMKVSPKQFEKQMAYLYKHKYHAKSLNGLYSKGKNVFLTFDDGYSDNYLIAYPALKRYNLKATIYISAQIIDDKAYLPIDENDELPHNRVLTWEELEKAQDIFFIGSHGLSHNLLTSLDDRALEKEIKESKTLIEKRLNITIDTFASPEGLYNEKVLDFIKKHYKTAVITARGSDFSLLNKDIYQIEREAISASDSLFMFKLKLWGVHRFLRKLRWLNFIRGVKR